MTKLSKRSEAVALSPIRKLAAFADEAERKGRKVHYLNIGQPDIKAPIEAIEKLTSTEFGVLKYCPSKGLTSYRNKLPTYYKRFGISIQPEDILITIGASEAIYLSLMACADPGDEIIIPEPFYANYQGFSTMAGLHIHPINSSIKDAFALPSVTDIEAAINDRTRAIMLCNPSNPTGYVYSKKDLNALAKIVAKHDIYLIVDEVYREFIYSDQEFYSALELENVSDNVIVIDSISKRYSACGARVGSIISRNHKFLSAVLKYAQFRLSAPLFGQILAEAAIDIQGSYLTEAVEEYNRRRLHLYNRLKAMPGVTCYLPEGAFYCFVELPIDDSDRFCQWLLESFEYKGQTVMLAPGSGFYASPGLGKKEVRIAYILNTNDLEKSMDCLEHALLQYPGRTIIN
ncbi:MAG: pyridoxal phosphate-dependent aminotransferase [Saprospiraceae bacterium]|nr:pyridoxal phosphate-dependent aminotransferase [Saprospiraceae bacterium]